MNKVLRVPDYLGHILAATESAAPPRKPNPARPEPGEGPSKTQRSATPAKPANPLRLPSNTNPLSA